MANKCPFCEWYKVDGECVNLLCSESGHKLPKPANDLCRDIQQSFSRAEKNLAEDKAVEMEIDRAKEDEYEAQLAAQVDEEFADYQLLAAEAYYSRNREV